MTLLISAITSEHITLATDRRLSYQDRFGRAIPREDDANKMIFSSNGFLFCYTGPAELGRKKTKTDLWIAESIEETDPSLRMIEIVDHLARKLQADISIYTNKICRYITIMILGWARFEDNVHYDPCLGIISTYLDLNFNTIPVKGTNKSTSVNYFLRKVWPHELPLIVFAGQNIGNDRRIFLKRSFQNFHSRRLSQSLMIDTLYKEIILTHRNNAWVGNGVLAAAISKLSAITSEASATIMSYGNMGSGRQFLYYPASRTQPFIKMPHFVTPGGGSFLDLGFRYLNDEKTDQEIVFRMT